MWDIHTTGAPETTSSVVRTASMALSALAIPAIATSCCPTEEEAFDPAAWVREGGDFHLVAPEAETRSMAPLVAALVDEVI